VDKKHKADDAAGSLNRSLNDAVAAAQAIMATVVPPGRFLSDELISERRAEAARD
jgi:hypothetical protein